MTDSTAPIPAADAELVSPNEQTGLYLDCTIPATATNDPISERFYLGEVGPMTILRLAAHTEQAKKAGDTGKDNEFASLLLKAIEQMMAADELERFDTWTHANKVRVPTMVDWIMAMIERQADRPLEEPSPSQDGPPTIGGGSTDGGEPVPETSPGQGSAL